VPLHDCGRPHAVDDDPCVQVPLVQVPVLPQGGLGVQRLCGSGPLATGAQVPLLLMLQAWQVGQLVAMQQAPSTQLPLVHSLPPMHIAPFAFFGTQPPGVVGVPLQYRFAFPQCVSAVQSLRHVVLVAQT
jgi:hypothetical protein